MVKVLALSLLLAVAGCQTSKGTFCAIASPIRPSQETIDKLTDAEVAALLRYNEKGGKLCGWRK